MDEDLAVVEYLEKSWSQFPMNRLWEETLSNSEVLLRFACQVETVRVLLAVVIGKRKGLREEIYALDMSQDIVLDKLLLAELSTMGDGYLLPLREMRYKVRREKQNPVALCREYMEQKLQDLLARPDWYASRIRKMERESLSVRVVGGGAPGLGKRH